MPNLYLIGGANSSGKTTVARTLLPKYLDTFEYVNADDIAAQLSPGQPETVAIPAGRLILKGLKTLANAGTDFAFESTLAGKNWASLLKNCKQQGYTLSLIYFWLNSPHLAITRVRRRVASGGHNIPEDVIRRRYQRGLHNLHELYLPLCDTWIIFDNSADTLELIAAKPPIIYADTLWENLTTNAQL